MPTEASDPTSFSTLYLAFDLGNAEWKLAFTTGPGHSPRFRSMPARDLTRLDEEVAVARERFALPADAVIVSCYEAGRDGFWLHRALVPRHPQLCGRLLEHRGEPPRPSGEVGTTGRRGSHCWCVSTWATSTRGALCTSRQWMRRTGGTAHR
jgi:hypothetical protein